MTVLEGSVDADLHEIVIAVRDRGRVISGSLLEVPPLDHPPPLQRAVRVAVQVCITFSLAVGAADIAGQHAPPGQRAIWFGLVGGTTALGAWRGWAWLLKLARTSRRP